MNSKDIPAEWLPNYTYQDYEKWEGDWEMIYGIPFAMSPSPKRAHQSAGRNFILLAQQALQPHNNTCQCGIYYELDWIVDDSTVVRPDVMIVCGPFDEDFLRFPPSLILEITSKRTQIADRNVKFRLYENNAVPYYLIADPERQSTDVFALVHGTYQLTQQRRFDFGEHCRIDMDLHQIWNGIVS
jgi:Uma2 family endonuclease